MKNKTYLVVLAIVVVIAAVYAFPSTNKNGDANDSKYKIDNFHDSETGANYYIISYSTVYDSKALAVIERKNADGSLYVTK